MFPMFTVTRRQKSRKSHLYGRAGGRARAFAREGPIIQRRERTIACWHRCVAVGQKKLNGGFGWKADIEFALHPCQPNPVDAHFRKHLLYGTLLVCAFLGSVSSVFRDDFAAKVVSVVCASILFTGAALYYVRHHRSLP